MQGRLLNKNLKCGVETVCSVSGREIAFGVDSDLNFSTEAPAKKLIFFIPMIDLGNLDAPSIVDDF